MRKLFIVTALLIGITVPIIGQGHDSTINSKLQLINKVRSEIDTSCVPSAIYITDKFNGSVYCGVLKDGKRVGKWITFDTDGLPDYIAYYSINGEDSISVNLVFGGTSIGSIVLHCTKIWASYFMDTLEVMAWETSDTTRIKFTFYSSGQIKSFGEVFLPHLTFLTRPLPFEEGRGKNKEWIYYNKDGNIIRKEWWEKGVLIKSEKH